MSHRMDATDYFYSKTDKIYYIFMMPHATPHIRTRIRIKTHQIFAIFHLFELRQVSITNSFAFVGSECTPWANNKINKKSYWFVSLEKFDGKIFETNGNVFEFVLNFDWTVRDTNEFLFCIDFRSNSTVFLNLFSLQFHYLFRKLFLNSFNVDDPNIMRIWCSFSQVWCISYQNGRCFS